MFEKIEPKPAFWYVRNGIAGTAHINRHGATVDFRPAKFYVDCYISRYHISDNPEQKPPAPAVTLYAAKGVQLERLYIADREVTGVSYRYPELTIVTIVGKLPNTGQAFTVTTSWPAHQEVPGWPRPAEQVAAQERACAEKRALAAAQPPRPSIEASAAAFGAWVHEAAKDRATRRILARFARTGRNNQQMQQLMLRAFTDSEHYFNLMQMNNSRWREMILAA